MFVLSVAELQRREHRSFEIQLYDQARAELASELGIDAIRKLRFAGKIEPRGTDGWQLHARLGATVVQPCVITLEPVISRIDENVTRRFVSTLPADPAPGSETELTADETEDQLTDSIDLMAVLHEALALSLPEYPRGPDAKLETAAFTRPGATPMTDEDARPFAGLSKLRSKRSAQD